MLSKLFSALSVAAFVVALPQGDHVPGYSLDPYATGHSSPPSSYSTKPGIDSVDSSEPPSASAYVVHPILSSQTPSAPTPSTSGVYTTISSQPPLPSPNGNGNDTTIILQPQPPASPPTGSGSTSVSAANGTNVCGNNQTMSCCAGGPGNSLLPNLSCLTVPIIAVLVPHNCGDFVDACCNNDNVNVSFSPTPSRYRLTIALDTGWCCSLHPL